MRPLKFRFVALIAFSPFCTRPRPDTSWRICSRNGELDGAELLRTASNGGKRVAILTLQMKPVVTICRLRQKLTRCDLFIAVRIVNKSFRACERFVARSHASPVAENITAA